MLPFIPIVAIHQAAKGLVITPIFEARERAQRKVNKTMNRANNDSYSYFEQRYQLGFHVDSPQVAGEFQYLYGNTMAWTAKKNYSFQNSDIYVAEVDPKTADGVFRIGRQLVVKGGQRIFEEGRFGERRKAFDLARYQNQNVDIFAGKVGMMPSTKDQSRLAGGSLDTGAGETLIVYKHDRSLFNEDYETFDQRYVLRRKLDYEFEGAVQGGTVNGDATNGWFAHGRIGKGLGKDWGTFIEADAFSGGRHNGESHQWVPLYPPAHDFYGLANNVGPINLNFLEASVYWSPKPRWEFTASWNHFELRDPRDGWYSTANVLTTGPKSAPYIDPTGKSGRELGAEFDVRGKYQLGKRDFVSVEAGQFQPGDFVRSFNGKNTVNQLWGIAYYQYDF